jgi:hypothetical protein
VEEKAIKSGKQVIKEFVSQAADIPDIDKGTIDSIQSLLSSDGKLSVTKLLRELERLRKT